VTDVYQEAIAAMPAGKILVVLYEKYFVSEFQPIALLTIITNSSNNITICYTMLNQNIF